MKRVFIVHGWDFNPEVNWYPWFKKELEKKGFKVIVPEMPNTSEPKINAWVSYLKKVVGKLDEETYFIGHSIGCQTIMRFLEKENYKGKIGKVIFVAGWFKLDNLENDEVKEIANPWTNTQINFNKVKQKLSSLIVFLSSNEPYGFVDYNARTFREKIGAKVIIENNKGHFTEDDGVKEVPEILKEIQDKTKVNCIIVHGSNPSKKSAMQGKPENMRHWKPWLKKNLKKFGIETSNQLYPEDWLPNYEKWKNVFEKNIINNNTTLVGHSAGTAFILRWLSENKRKVDKVILIAPSVIKSGKYFERSKLKDFSYDSSLKKYFNKLVIFYSDDDDEHIIKSAKKVHKILGGKLINLKERGHFTLDDMGTEKFPELLKEILKISK